LLFFQTSCRATEEMGNSSQSSPNKNSVSNNTIIEKHALQGFFDEEETQLVKILEEAGQLHIFEEWSDPKENVEQKRSMMNQLRHLNETCPGNGLQDYITRAKVLLASSLSGDNPLEGWTPRVPEGIILDPESKEGIQRIAELEAIGAEEIPCKRNRLDTP